MTVLCFGDSNTWGYDPRSWLADRYNSPWPEHLAQLTGWNIRNEGQNGRRIPREMPLRDCDLLIVLLGTNDLLQGCSPRETSLRMKSFLNTVSQRILLISPPAMTRGEWVPEDSLVEASRCLAREYKNLAAEQNILFCDASQWQIPLCFDGVHFTQAGHIAFAEHLYQHLISL